MSFFRTSVASEVYYEDSGGPAPVLFFIYGLGCCIRHWKYPMAHFRGLPGRPFRLVWMDFRGHGKSPAIPLTMKLGIGTIVADIRALCAHLGIDGAVFLGQSMGGTIALQLAHDAPELTKALVLLASPGRDPGLTMEPQPLMRWLWNGLIRVTSVAPPVQLNAAPLATNPLIMGALTEIVRYGGFNPELTKTEDIDEYVRGVLEVDPRLFFDMARDLAGFDVAALEPSLTCPALIIAGALDKVVPLAETERLAAALPGARLTVVPHGSHCPHFDDPGLVNRTIAGFLLDLGLLAAS
jgi:pimeloyl-ACP methyl ester carboxylesterase